MSALYQTLETSGEAGGFPPTFLPLPKACDPSVDIHISLSDIAAGACWTLGLVLILFDIWIPGGDSGYGRLGLYVAGVGGVLTCRHYSRDLHEREQRAFDLGRDHEQSKVRQLR